MDELSLSLSSLPPPSKGLRRSERDELLVRRMFGSEKTERARKKSTTSSILCHLAQKSRLVGWSLEIPLSRRLTRNDNLMLESNLTTMWVASACKYSWRLCLRWRIWTSSSSSNVCNNHSSELRPAEHDEGYALQINILGIRSVTCFFLS